MKKTLAVFALVVIPFAAACQQGTQPSVSASTSASPAGPPQTTVAPPPPPATITTTTSAKPAPKGDPSGTLCPKIVMAGESPAEVRITTGPVPCDEATRTMQDYFLKLQRGDSPGLAVGDWLCTTKGDQSGSVCTADGRGFETVPYP